MISRGKYAGYMDLCDYCIEKLDRFLSGVELDEGGDPT